MAILSVVLWTRFCLTKHQPFSRYPLSRPVQALWRKAYEIYAILPLVPSQNPTHLGCKALSRIMQQMWLANRLRLLELLPLV